MRVTLADMRPDTGWQRLRGAESMLAGAGAGLISSVLTCPLDVVKTKLQAQGKIAPGEVGYHGLFGTCGRIWSEEGFKGFYRGLGPTIFGYLPTWAIYFSVYDLIKTRLRDQQAALGIEASATEFRNHIIAAMTAGACSTTATNPLWVIKTRFMTQSVQRPEHKYRHTGDAIRRIYQTEGWRGFYRGLLPSLIGVTHVAVQFPLYERFKRARQPKDGSDIPPHTILLCSSTSKMIASVTTYPHEVLRTRLQVQRASARHASHIVGEPLPPASHVRRGVYVGITQIAQNIWHDEGARGFYRGLFVNLLRTVPSSAMTILTYEIAMRKLYVLTKNPHGLNGKSR